MTFVPEGLLPETPPSKEYLDAVSAMSGRFLATGQANPPEGVTESEEVRQTWRAVDELAIQARKQGGARAPSTPPGKAPGHGSSK